MNQSRSAPATIDEYIAAAPEAVQHTLQLLRKTIHEAAPEAQEKMSYRIPTFTLRGNLIHFAAWNNHIALYPGVRALQIFKDEVSSFRTAKGTIRFPLHKPLPLALIARIVQFCVAEHQNANPVNMP